jgi:hypothetical protein
VAALSLWLISFPDKAVPGQVAEDTLLWMGLIDSPITIIPGLIAAYFYAQYRINRSSNDDTQRELELRQVNSS